MKKTQVDRAAELLFESRINKKSIFSLPDEITPQSVKDSYNIQNSLTNLYLKDKNNKIVGKKIGCTNLSAQKQINVNEPFYGNIFSKYSSANNIILKKEEFINPFYEPEFSFKLKDNLIIKKQPIKTNDLLNIIESIIPSVEIVDSRFVDWTKIGINNIIADNGANAFWIKGAEFKDIRTINLDDFEVSIYSNRKLIQKGNSKNVLNNPLNSLLWLINKISLNNLSILNNLIISTGTCTPAIKLKTNDKINADFGTLGSVEFSLI